MKAHVDAQGKTQAVLDGRQQTNDAPQPGTAEWSEEVVQARAFLKALAEQPDTYLHCRAYRHAWEVMRPFHDAERTIYTAEGHPQATWQILQVLSCSRCPRLRYDWYLSYQRAGITRLEKVDMTYGDAPGDIKYAISGSRPGTKPQELVLAAMYERSMRRVARAKPGDRESADA